MVGDETGAQPAPLFVLRLICPFWPTAHSRVPSALAQMASLPAGNRLTSLQATPPSMVRSSAGLPEVEGPMPKPAVALTKRTIAATCRFRVDGCQFSPPFTVR